MHRHLGKRRTARQQIVDAYGVVPFERIVSRHDLVTPFEVEQRDIQRIHEFNFDGVGHDRVPLLGNFGEMPLPFRFADVVSHHPSQ